MTQMGVQKMLDMLEQAAVTMTLLVASKAAEVRWYGGRYRKTKDTLYQALNQIEYTRLKSLTGQLAAIRAAIQRLQRE